MKLKLSALKEKQAWLDKNIALPASDLEQVAAKTMENPGWVHFGAGNIFRIFPARAHQVLLDQGLADTGIVAVETFDFEIVERVFDAYDNLTLSVIMKADGSLEKTVVGSIVKAMTSQVDNGDFDKLASFFTNPSLQMASFTITEKGYAIKDHVGNYFGAVKADMEGGPKAPLHAMSVLTSLLNQRYQAGKLPLAVVSMDNCSHNGDKIKAAVTEIAKVWAEKEFVEQDFLDYLEDPTKVSFPLSMIDKITPRPSEKVQEVLEEIGLEDMGVIITEKNSYTAPFVNAEVSEYLVIEDLFPNGRPPLEKAGILFGDRETVNKVETMKVTTCLNPLHTALAVTGCLLGYTLIADEMNDEELKKLVMKIGYDEGLPVVINPGIIDPKVFIDEVVGERFVNPYIPDTPQRIATDTSQKVAIRFGETIKSYVKDPELDPASLVGIPLALAAWLRYLVGVDDNGNEMPLSSDPMLEVLAPILQKVKLGDDSADLTEILKNQEIFGVDLYEVGLGNKVEKMFLQMISKEGAVRETLKAYLT
ncbi:mannitol dehydrogenase family protein [Alkalibacter mobilis]|uniref:mannitol dehydrogenase family protein n=1 Tax=Alkalibacter mobilis TaxID=2787712 RepID=UPI0018A08CD3|nr:mannitol dehydrogenase family protein [Alkalibacter mobilis]MBF7097285.1 mannitol dehydrogenase family protein [Alkalibacter mobilis]